MKDDYFLVGYADDFIDDVHVDGLVWQDWMWDMGEYGAIYAWGDGFRYPMGNLANNTGLNPYQITFTFGEIWWTGLLDFQYISWTNQRDRLGSPRFRASASITGLGSHVTLNEGKIYGSSRWDSPTDPENSERTYEIRTTYNVSYNDGTTWFNACLEVGVGNWWAEWGLTGGTHDDIGIPLNLTLVNFDSNLPTGWLPPDHICWWEVRLKDYTVDAYSCPNLNITGMECDTGDSKGKIAPEYTIAMDFGGEIILTIAGIAFGVPRGQTIGLIGSLVGVGMIGGAAVINYVQGQEVSRYATPVPEDHHWQLQSTRDLKVNPPAELTPECKSVSDIIFLGLDPTAGKHCGLTKIVLKGTLQASYVYYHCKSGLIFYIDYPIGNIEITLCIPWFLWP